MRSLPRSTMMSPVRSPEKRDPPIIASMRLWSTLAPAAGGATRRMAQASARRRDAVRDMSFRVPGSPGRRALAGDRELLADGLEEALVDLAVVDRDRLLVTQ